jgi:hypothetical protein
MPLVELPEVPSPNSVEDTHSHAGDGEDVAEVVAVPVVVAEVEGLAVHELDSVAVPLAVEVPEAVVWDARPPGPARPHPEAMRPAADDLIARALLLVRPRPPG